MMSLYLFIRANDNTLLVIRTTYTVGVDDRRSFVLLTL